MAVAPPRRAGTRCGSPAAASASARAARSGRSRPGARPRSRRRGAAGRCGCAGTEPASNTASSRARASRDAAATVTVSGVEGKDPPAAADRLHLARRAFDDRMDDLQRLAGAGPAPAPRPSGRTCWRSSLRAAASLRLMSMVITLQSARRPRRRVTISPAAGAALAPPYPAFSMTIANAIRRLAGPNGANPTNQPCEASPATSAVPVFPAISQGWLRRLRPVPPSTTSRMIAAEQPRGAGIHDRCGLRRGGVSGRFDVGLAQHAVGRDRCGDRRHPQRRRDDLRLPVADLRQRLGDPLIGPRPGRLSCLVSGIRSRLGGVEQRLRAELRRQAARSRRCTNAPPSCMPIVPCGCVSSTSSRTGRPQPGMAAPTRPSGSAPQV